MINKRGRPRKDPDRISVAHFFRAGKVVSLYEQARRNGEKHDSAINYAVETLKRNNPTEKISATEVRRILARFRPQNAKTVLRFKPSPVGKRKRTRLQEMFRSAARGMRLPEIEPGLDASKFEPKTKYRFGFGPKETFPRTNRKLPGD